MSETLETLAEDRVVAVVRAARIADPVGLCAALAEGGIRSVELTMTAANAVEAIAACAAAGFQVGAGTVTSAAQVDEVAAAGAGFVVSPGLSEEVVERGAELGVATIPGTFTPSEVMRAAALDPAAIKVYPAHLGGPRYLAELCSVLGPLSFVPSGGIGEDNAAAFLAAGALAIGSGSVAPAAQVESGEHEPVAERARRLCAAIAAGETPGAGG